MQYRLRTLLIVLAVGPLVLAALWSAGARVANDPVRLAFFITLLVFLAAFLLYGLGALILGVATARVVDTIVDWFKRAKGNSRGKSGEPAAHVPTRARKRENAGAPSKTVARH